MIDNSQRFEGFMSREDTYLRMNGTLCYYKGAPGFVDVVRNSTTIPINEILFRELGQEALLGVDVTDPDFKFKDYNIGYINFSSTRCRKAKYLCRMPARSQKYGLSLDFLHVHPEGNAANWHNIEEKYFKAMFTNNYPTKDVALRMVVDSPKNEACAFHKDVCFIREPEARVVSVGFRGRVVAHWDTRKNRAFLIPTEDDHIIESLIRNRGVDIF